MNGINLGWKNLRDFVYPCMNPYTKAQEIQKHLRSSNTPDQFRVSQKMTLSFIDELETIIKNLEDKFIKRRDDQEYADQLRTLKDETLRLLREKALTLGEV